MLLVLSLCLGISAFYDLIEWRVAEFTGTDAEAFALPGAREPLINVHFRHHGVRDAPKHVRPCRNAASLVLTKMLYKSELP